MEAMDGFTYISNRVKEFYPDQQEQHYASILSYRLGGKDPLDGIGVWKSEKGCPHWIYVTYGFTDLYDEEDDDFIDEDDSRDNDDFNDEEGLRDNDEDNYEDNDEFNDDYNNSEDFDDDCSGYGFELTFRLKRSAEDNDTPPVWPMNMLQNLARYVFSTGNVFASGHHLNGNGPLALDTNTQLTCLGFITDPEFGTIETVNGSMVFLEAVAITHDEMDAMMCWSGENFLNELCRQIPYGIADLSRTTLMCQPDFRSAWEQGVARDGSSTSLIYLSEAQATLKGNKGSLILGAGHIVQVVTLIKARLDKDRKFLLQNGDTLIGFESSKEAKLYMDMDNGVFVIAMTKDALNEFCHLLKPHIGIYTMTTMPLTIEVIPTNNRDSEGNIVETIE